MPFIKNHIPWNKDTKGKMSIPWNKGIKQATNTGRTHFKKGVIPWNKGLQEVKVKICEVCNCEFKKPYGFNIGRWKKQRFCSLECSGKGNSNWKGGITPINFKIRNSKDFQNWRIAVFERDDFTCQICEERGGKLRANHIKTFAKHPDLRFELSNGITICQDCDYRWVFRKEEEMESYFNFNLETRRLI